MIARLQQEGAGVLPEIRAQLVPLSSEDEKKVAEELSKFIEFNK